MIYKIILKKKLLNLILILCRFYLTILYSYCVDIGER